MPDFTAPGTPTDYTREPLATDLGPMPAGFTGREADEPDPDLGGIDVGDELDDLSALRAELTADEAKTDTDDLLTTIEVPRRPGYSIRCRLDFTGRDLENLRRQSKDKRFADNLDSLKVSSLLLGLTCVAILRNGRPVLDDGQPVTFQTGAFRAFYGDGTVDQTVRKFFVLEGHVESASRALLDVAGWNDDLSPTQ